MPQTLLVKFLGSIGSVAGGLAIGKEGPLVHIGACIAALLSQASATWPLPLRTLLRHFHNDRDRRDMVTCGAAAGVAAAFRAPVGGVLFALEEAASWWRPRLTWRTLFCAAVVTVTLKTLIRACDGGRCGGFGGGGFIIFDISGGQDDYYFYELLPVSVLGITGGLLGALFNHISEALCTWRGRTLAKRRPSARVVEALLVAALTSIISFCVPLLVSCRACPADAGAECPRPADEAAGNFVGYNCRSGYNDLATIFFNTNDDSIRNLLSSGTKHEFTTRSLLVYLILMFALAVVTYGISVPSGLFVPCILIGACYGRLVGKVMSSAAHHVEEGTYALLGAASFLGGTMRMTVSLTVILLELTNQLALLPLVMLVLLIAKSVGDCINKAIYDIHIDIKRLPFLESAPPRTQQHLRVEDVARVLNRGPDGSDLPAAADDAAAGKGMPALAEEAPPLEAPADGGPVVALREVARVGDLVDRLRATPHSCFPVLGRAGEADDAATAGDELKGTVLRSTLTVLLRHRSLFFKPGSAAPGLSAAEAEALQGEMHEIERKKPSVSAPCRTLAELLEEAPPQAADADLLLDLGPFVNRSPYVVPEGTSFPKVYSLFRTLGLRHLLVVPRPGSVSAVVTRKDLVPAFSANNLKDKVVNPAAPFSLTQLPTPTRSRSTRRTTSYIRYE